MSELSKLGKKVGLEERHISSVGDLVGVIGSLPDEVKNKAADIAISASGIDITALLDRLTPNQKIKVMAWAMRQGQK